MNIIEILTLAAIVVCYGFCFWLISDCIANEKDIFKRIAWIAFIFFTGIIGGSIYYFTQKKKLTR